MGADNALFTHTGSTDAQNARLALAGLQAVQGPTALDIRTGVLIGPGSRSLITGTSSTAPMRVAIAPHGWVNARSAASGPYLGKLPAQVLVDIAAAPGSGTRIDVVYERQTDSTAGVPSPDAATAPEYGVKTGTVGLGKPSLSTIVGASEIGTVTVVAGATRTDSAGVTIANTARQTVARGARVPVLDQADRDSLTAYPSLEVYRLDTGQVQLCTAIGPTVWATTYDPANPGPARCSVYQTVGGQTMANNAFTPVDFDGEHTDPFGMHSAVTNISRVTVTSPGDYEVCGVVGWAVNGTGQRLAVLAKNGVQLPGSGGSANAVSTIYTLTVTPTIIVPLAANDYIQVLGFQNVGGPILTAPGGAQGSSLTVRRVN